jgi:hypothetical protein
MAFAVRVVISGPVGSISTRRPASSAATGDRLQPEGTLLDQGHRRGTVTGMVIDAIRNTVSRCMRWPARHRGSRAR